jgi:type III pantothenate kinase
MTSLVIDIGNTLIKIAVFKLDEMLEVSQYETIDMPVLNALLNKYNPVKAIISSVKKMLKHGRANWGKKFR